MVGVEEKRRHPTQKNLHVQPLLVLHFCKLGWCFGRYESHNAALPERSKGSDSSSDIFNGYSTIGPSANALAVES